MESSLLEVLDVILPEEAEWEEFEEVVEQFQLPLSDASKREAVRFDELDVLCRRDGKRYPKHGPQKSRKKNVRREGVRSKMRQVNS